MILLRKYTFFLVSLILLFFNLNKADNEDLRLIKEFAKTWDLNKEVTFSDELLKPQASVRDTVNAINGGYGCQQPGFTGQYCEFPICEYTNTVHTDKDPVSVLVDFIHQKSCNQNAPLYVDVSMFAFTIEVHAPGSPQPTINVYRSNGTLLPPYSIDTTDPTKSIFTYSTQNPGVYQIAPSTNTPQTGCFIYVSSIAQSHVDIGFIPSFESSWIPAERNDFPLSNAYLSQPNTIVAHTINIKEFGGISTFSIYKNYNVITRPQLASKRYGCLYGYYFNSFFCYKRDYYFIKVEGYDFFGNSFSRIKAFNCIEGPVTPPPPTTVIPPQPTSCANNGTLITNGDGTTYCYCKNLFTSYDCSKRICLNKGAPLGDGSCFCKSGYSGDHCQDIKCSSEIVNMPKHFHQPIFVIRLRQQMTKYISQLVGKIQAIAQDLGEQEDNWFKNFGVLMFNNNGSVLENNRFNSVEGLINYLTSKISNTDTSGDSTDIVFSSITTVIQEFQSGSHSPIYVLTDALPNDLDYFDNICNYNAMYLQPIYFFVFQQSLDTSWDFYSPQWRALEKLAERFSGNVFPIFTSDSSNFGNIFYNHMSATYFKSELMYGDDIDICAESKRISTIAVDSQFDYLAIVATGINLDLQLITPDGNNASTVSTFNSTSIYIWTFKGLHSGQWQFNVTPHDSITSCSIRAYAVVTIYSQKFIPHYRLYWSLTPLIKIDGGMGEPLLKYKNSVVARLHNYVVKDPTKISAEIVIHSKTGSGKNMSFASNGIWRDGCAYQIYFAPFQCYNRDETLYFTIFVRDKNDFYIQRAGSMYCTGYTSTSSPPSSCFNGGFEMNNTCICPPMFTGKYCESPICLNGGTPAQLGCTCPALVSGFFCQIIKCPSKPITPEPLKKNQSLTFLLDVTYTNRLFLKQLSIYSDVMIRDIITQGTDIFGNIYVYGFDETSMAIPIGITDANNVELINSFFKQAYNMSLNATQKCVQAMTWQALNIARMMSDPYSQVFLIQSSNPEEGLITLAGLYSKVTQGFFDKGLTLTTYIKALGKNNYYCGGGGSVFKTIKDFTEQTYQGDYLEVSNPSLMNIPKIIPSFVDSGIAYKKPNISCGGSCFIYFSVDSHTQNIQVKVKGNIDGYSVQLITPKQTIDNSSYVLINDTATGVTVLESRKDCDFGWESLGPQYCMKYVTTPSSWYSAHDDCMNNKGFLVDDMYPSKDSYITGFQNSHNITSVWIGLTSSIPFSTDGSWVWNRDPLKSVPLMTPIQYSNWNPKAVLNDTTKQCAYKTLTWNTDSCTSLRPYICQKHKYQDSFTPSLSESEKLPPGKWRINVTSTGTTSIEVRVQSKIKIYSGFVSNIHSDDANKDANSLSSNQYMVTHVSLINKNIFNSYLVNSRMFYPNGTMFEAVTYQPRDSCAYQFISQAFTCPSTSHRTDQFYALTTGVDEWGYTIQRYTTHICVKQVKKCNNGVSYNGECFCNDGWIGSLCEIPICQNGATFNNVTNTCTCATGYTGPLCDLPVCFNQSPNKISRDGKLFVLVIENTIQNLNAINSLKSVISTTLKSLNPNWFSEYVYVLFDSTYVTVVQRFFSIDDYVTSFQNIVTKDDYNFCGLEVFKALMVAFQQLGPQQSIVYTVTRAIPSDADYRGFDFAKTLMQTSPQLYYHFLSGDSGCTTNMSDYLVSRIQLFAIGSGGNVLITTEKDAGNAFSTILPSLYRGSPINNLGLYNTSCSNGITTYAYVDRNTTDIYFYIYGTYPSITVLSPGGEPIVPKTVFSGQAGISPRLFIYQVSLITEYGMYTFKITSAGTCYTQVRATGSSELYYGFVPSSLNFTDIGKHIDNATSIPMNDYNQMVGSIVGDKATLKYVGIFDTDTNEFSYLKFSERVNCTYKYYSEIFKCSKGHMLLRFYSQDSSGFTIIRESLTMCGQYIVQPSPGPSTATPSGVITTVPSGVITTTPSAIISTTPSQLMYNTKSNIYLINDVSTNVPSNVYAPLFTDFLMQFFSNFQINSNYVNVAITSSPGDQSLWELLPTFDTYSGLISLRTNINASYYPIFGPQTPGQSQLKDTINMALNPNFINTGYNPFHKPHIIIYLTTTSSPDSNAIAAANKVRQSGKFKIISIAYQPISNIDSLNQMSDCLYKPASLQDLLMELATNMAKKVSVSSALGVEYEC